MDILQGKRVAYTFLGIKAHRYSLHGPDVVHGTLLLKIGKGNMAVLLIWFPIWTESRSRLTRPADCFIIAGNALL